jgi:glycine dehydrogenase subunit 1
MTISHRFLPTTNHDKQNLLSQCGVNSIEDLLKGIPEEIQFKKTLNLGLPLSEYEIKQKLTHLLKNSRNKQNAISFLGAGVYDHYAPAAINQLLLRGEFLTSYTPYQAEMAQGTLQALFEFQTMIARIFGMDVSNASHYDGATSMAEAALMALRIQPSKKNIVVSAGVHPEYIDVLKTYTTALDVDLNIVPLDENGTTNQTVLKEQLNEQSALAIVQSPNFFGVVEDTETLCAIAKKYGALFSVNVTEPLSLAVLKTPGECGADIATGEGQSFGLPQSFGGPYVGLFTTRKEYVRQIPGRLCGETLDANGRRSYTLTLSTREQHIRREKATSNICTNQNLCALWAAIWLALVGQEGFVELAEQNLSKSEYAKSKLTSLKNVKLRYHNSLNFNEFVIDLPCSANDLIKKCVKNNVMPGLPLSRFDSSDAHGLLIAITERKSRDDIDHLCELIKKFCLE